MKNEELADARTLLHSSFSLPTWMEACELLATQPEMGSNRPKWTNKPVRFWPVRKNYLIVYVPESEPLEILRIFNAARDVPKLLNG